MPGPSDSRKDSQMSPNGDTHDRAARVFTVAIDGPAAAGKGTLSRAVADHFGFAHLDTGSLYRAVGVRAAEEAGGQPAAITPERAAAVAADLGDADLARDDLRTARAAEAASVVAAMPAVRAALLEFQRRFARRPGGAVLDGRDIGTVICPTAEAKLFVTASDAVRAGRRFRELQAAGADTDFDTVLADLRARDARDSGRKDAPLARADDAVLLDTSELSIDAAVSEAVTAIENRLKSR